MTPNHEPGTHRRRLAHDPSDHAALQQLGLLEAQQGDGIRAINLFARAARLHGRRDLLDGHIADSLHLALNQAIGWIEKGAVDEAGELLDRLAELAPSNGDLQRIRGIAHLIQGHDEEARRLRTLLTGSESGFATAVDAVSRHKADYDYVGTVVIPAYRMEDTIGRALDSVAAAVRYYRTASGQPDAQIHICVVDDGSPDGTATATLNWAAAHPDQSVALIASNRNRGAGRARNVGAAAAMGRYLWFLDADDLYLERHLLLTAGTLDRQPDAAFVRTGIVFDQIDQDISPTWRQASETSYPCNLCVRRSCHELTGGFPEEPPFHPAVADDVAYARALHSLFPGIVLQEKTVHYTMRPGNALSRQHAEMTGPGKPGDGAQPNARFQAIEILTRRKLYALDRKRVGLVRDGGWKGPPLLSADGRRVAPTRPPVNPGQRVEAGAADPGTWLAEARDLLRAGDRRAALLKLRKGAAMAPADVEIWFEMGVAAYALGFPAPTLRAFQVAVAIRPDLPVPQFNLGSVLLETGAVVQAALRLRLAVALRPDHVSTLIQSGRAVRRLGRLEEAHGLLARAAHLDAARADLNAEVSQLALERGDGATALQHGRRATVLSPDLYSGQAAVAAALESLGRNDEASLAWQRAIRCNPGFGEAFTRHTLLQLTRVWGPPPARPAATQTGRRLACTTLGVNGRFGNQLLQYGVARLYADAHELELEVPYWLGRHLYDRDDALPGPPLPRLTEEEADLLGSLNRGSGPVHADRDIEGYFCGDTARLAPFRDQFRGYFQPGRNLRAHADAIAANLRRAGNTIVALHLRRGDFGWGQFWTAPEAWYLRWLEEVWPELDRPALLIATDDPACVRPFAAYRPLTGRDLAEPVAGIEFFADFHALCQADLIAISNSTFSFVASLLNRNARGFFRPDRSVQRLVPYDPWSAPVLL